MDTHAPDQPTNAEMKGRRVLALLGPPNKDRTMFLTGLLEEARQRWDWQLNVLCDSIAEGAFKTLVEPDGATFALPHLLKEADWERDPTQVAATEQRMREAEIVTSIPTGRLILAAAHSIGKAYNVPFRRARSYKLVRRVLKDNQEPFRLARRFFRFADDLLEKIDADIIYTYEWGPTPLHFAFWMAAQRRGITCLSVRFSKINASHAYWTTDRLMLNVAARELANTKRQTKASVSTAAAEYVETFRNQPRVIQYIANKWGAAAGRSLFRWHLQYGRLVLREFVNRFRGQDLALREPPFSRLIWQYQKLYLTGRQRRFFQVLDEEALENMKYVYLPLHKDAEFAQTFQATTWHDQRNTVRVFASMLPAGYRLLVREHRMNSGFRQTRGYREFLNLPNVVLLDPLDSQFKYLRHADLVVTENGSSGWEGLVLGRRVLLLARTFYEGAGLGVTINDPDRLNAAILEILDQPPVADAAAYDADLGRMVDAELETTFPMDETDKSVAMDQLAERLAPLLLPRTAPL